MKSFTRIVFFVLYFGHYGQRHFWSKSLNVLIQYCVKLTFNRL